VVSVETDDPVLGASLRRAFARRRREIERCLSGRTLPPRPCDAVIALGISRRGWAPGLGGDYPGDVHACFSVLSEERFERGPSGERVAGATVTVRIDDAPTDR
jgi:hypothetical protein